MLRWRLILGPLIVAALAALCWLDWHAARPGIFLLPLALVASWLGAGELLAMYRRRTEQVQPLAWVVYGGVLLTVLAAGAPVLMPAAVATSANVGQPGWLAIGLAAGLFLALVGELCRYESPGAVTSNLALSALAILYVGGMMGFIVQLRLLGGGRAGMLALISLIATVKMSDTGQYNAGRLFGKRKLAPRVSPGKTWEGVIGGVLFAIIGAWLVLTWGTRTLLGTEAAVAHPVAIIAFAVAVTAAGIVGDLSESLLKRDVKVKDSSTWLPGFGGVLDLLDSLLGAAPVAYLFWALGWL